MKLRTLLIISMTAAILIPLFISTLYFTFSLRSLIDGRLIDRELPSTLERLRNAIELELQESLIISKSIAENTYILDWVEEGEPQDRLNSVTRYLSKIKKENNAITAFIVSSVSNNYYNVDGVLKKLSPSAERDQWFYNFLNSGVPYGLSVDVDQSTGQAAVFINYTVKMNDKPVAVGGIGRSLAGMTELIRGFRIGEKGHVYLVNKEGKVMLHKDKEAVGAMLSSLVGSDDIGRTLIQSNVIKIDEFEREGEGFIVASLRLKSLDWYLVAELSKAELYKDLNQTLISNLVIIILIAAIFIAVVAVLSKQIVDPIRRVSKAIYDISQRGGDLTARLPISGQQEIGELAENVNLFIAKLQRICLEIRDASRQIDDATNTVNQLMGDAAQKTSQQQQGTEMVATAVNEMGATVQEIAKNASDAAALSQEAESESATGLKVVNSTVKDIGHLKSAMDSSVESVETLASEIQSISSVLDVIKGISEQTNLLALNAAIEAARAGEMGRGFAVVADEVRTLAQRTAQSTEEINEMISKLDNSAKTTVNAIQSGSALTASSVSNAEITGQTISKMAEKISYISNTNISVAAATEEQSTVTEEINKNITEISDFAHSTSHNIKQCEALCDDLKLHVNTLSKTLQQFTLE
ncbi:methyl-accepting chemotaxis protein [Aestuariibacter sp. AA17]|uniref:Methyl-accepting chemotaxis protein n=1 Tax=Fluctibacter corallii TaxID=2984329 RepID=A0ABT3A4W0_9ALTE|nr:methyl-accepting chemotaxis protein [Aestuariibacter sp. AA17]MCV2883722.1 methyl-accepting chemotaxis protein [Aestuariibacter sp. AA17]